VLIISYENEFNLHIKEISFSFERMSTKTRFEEEAKRNSEWPIPNGGRAGRSFLTPCFSHSKLPHKIIVIILSDIIVLENFRLFFSQS